MSDIATLDAIPSPLLKFIEFLQQSQSSTGIIKVPASIKDVIKHYINPLPFIPLPQVEALVAAIDHEGPAICRRMDLHTFTIVYVILNRSEEGLAHQRGLCLLAESLFEPSVSPPEESVSRLGKKIQIGHKNLVSLIRGLGKEDKAQLTKRWMGILALELVRGCDQNKKLLLRESEVVWRSLGLVMLHARCGILKLVAGLTMSEVWPSGAPKKEKWFTDDDLEIYASFPQNDDQSSQWIVAFESYTDALVSEKRVAQQISAVFLAYAVSFGDMSYNIEEESAILITVSEYLSIMIPTSQAVPARCVDIPLCQINDITMDGGDFEAQSGSFLAKSLVHLIIWMRSATNQTFYFNSAHYAAPSINIAFTSPEDARAVLNSLTKLKSCKNENLEIFQSQTIDVSQHVITNNETLENLQQSFELDSANGTTLAPNEMHNHDLSTPINPFLLRDIHNDSEPDFTEPFMEWPGRTSQNRGTPVLKGELVSIANDPIEVYQDGRPSMDMKNPQPWLVGLSEPRTGSPTAWRSGAEVAGQTLDLNGGDRNLEDEVATLFNNCTLVNQVSSERVINDDSPNLLTVNAEGKDQTHDGHESLSELKTITRGLKMDLSASAKKAKVDSTGRPVKISQRMRKNLGSPTKKSFEVARTVIEEPAKYKSTSRSSTSSTQGALSLVRDNRSSLKARNSKNSSVKEGKNFLAGTASNSRGPPDNRRSKNIKPNQSSVAKARSKAKGKANVGIASEPRFGDTIRRSGRWKNDLGTLSTTLPLMHKTNEVRNDDIDNTNWEEGLVVDEDLAEKPRDKKLPVKRKPKRSPKRSRNKDDHAYSVKKGLPNTNRRIKKNIKSAVPQPAPTRAAAATANKSTARRGHDAKNNPQEKPSPINLIGSSTGKTLRIIPDPTSPSSPIATSREKTKEAQQNTQPAHFVPLPKNEERKERATHVKLNLLAHDVQPSPTSRQDPPAAHLELTINDYKACHGESNLKKTLINSPLGLSSISPGRMARDGRPIEEEIISNMRETNLRKRPTPLKPSEKRMRNDEKAGFEDFANFEGLEDDFSADTTLFPYETVGSLRNTNTFNAPEAPEHYSTPKDSPLPHTPQKTSRTFNVESRITNQKFEVPVEVEARIPIAKKFEDALASVVPRSVRQIGPDACIRNTPNPQPSKAQDLPNSRSHLQAKLTKGICIAKDETLTTELTKYDEEGEPVTISKQKPTSDKAVRLLFNAEGTLQNHKRESDQIQGPRKKSKTNQRSEPRSALTAQNGNPQKTSEQITPDVDRKSNLISFSSNGPRNQGTLQSLKYRSCDLPHSQKPRFSANHKIGLAENVERVDRYSSDPLTEVSILEHTRNFVPDSGPSVIRDRNSRMARGTSHKPSSQSMRVDLNGSPMPFVHSRHFNMRPQESGSPSQVPESPLIVRHSIDNSKRITMLNDKLNNMDHPVTVPSRSPHALINYEPTELSNNKQGPSSPTQPSRILGELAAHSIHPDGRLVNLQTDAVVMPIKPQDPFLGTKQIQARKNSFIDLLRQSTNAIGKGPNSRDERSAHMSTKKADPNKARVDENRDNDVASRNLVASGNLSSENTSNSSSSSSRLQSPLRGASDGIEEPLSETAWHSKLGPDQRDTLDILCEVSHRLVANLVDKETAIDDLISDYKRGGMRIIDHLEKARQQDLDAFQNQSNLLKRKLIALYKNEKAELEGTMKAMKKRPVAHFEEGWDARQQALWTKMDSALAACE